jgi:FMN phosphatase YigB (HAD superfamily)
VNLDGIVLDLDDTLYDTTRLLLPWADRRAVAAMCAAGLDMDDTSALARLLELRAAGVVRTFAELARERGADARCVALGEDAWFAYDPPPMTLDADVESALDALRDIAPLALFTMGHVETQRKKLERLGIASRFVDVRLVDFRAPDGKTAALRGILADRGWTAARVVVCGDRPDGDVRAGNVNGCLTVLVRRGDGEFANVAPASKDDVPWRTIAGVAELPALLR